MTRPLHYVECDVPEGMTLADYRAAKAAARQRRVRLLSRLLRRAPDRPRDRNGASGRGDPQGPLAAAPVAPTPPRR